MEGKAIKPHFEAGDIIKFHTNYHNSYLRNPRPTYKVLEVLPDTEKYKVVDNSGKRSTMHFNRQWRYRKVYNQEHLFK